MKRIHAVARVALLAGATAIVAVGCKTNETKQAASTGSYPLTKCVVSGEDLGTSPYVFVHNGQTVKLCCKDCLAKFDQDPAKYLAKLNEAK